jgi:hypothetical protein
MTDKPDVECTEIGEIGNYYGGLSVKREGGKCYWSIENWDGDHWHEIPDSLFVELLKHEEDRPKSKYLTR